MTKQEIEQLIELLDKMLWFCELPDDKPFWDLEDGCEHIRKYLKGLLNESNN